MSAISVLIPCYNAEFWLETTLNSVTAQSYNDFEVIIVDDGSTDGTAMIAKKFVNHDARFHYYKKDNGGIADALNFGLGVAKGEWVARLDADDVCHQDRLKLQMQAVRLNKSAVFCGSDSFQMSADGQLLRRCSYPTTHQKLLNSLLKRGKFPAHSSAFFNRKVAVAVGGYRRRIRGAEDVDLWLRIAQFGQLCSVPRPLIHYRIHGSQISTVDGGIRCFSDALLANFSHYCRRNNVLDPVDVEEEHFTELVQYIDLISAKSPKFRHLANLDNWHRVKRRWQKNRFSFSAIVAGANGAFTVGASMVFASFHRNKDINLIKGQWARLMPGVNYHDSNLVR